MEEIKAPTYFVKKDGVPYVFLAGSIEMGAATDWQKQVVEECKETNIHFLNPRRDDWDSSWKQTIDDIQFNTQVTWELEYLERCDYILMYIDPMTKSPITLLEFGLYANNKVWSNWNGCYISKLIVCCPDGFYRKGNVDIVCKRYRIQVVNSLSDLIETAKRIKR